MTTMSDTTRSANSDPPLEPNPNHPRSSEPNPLYNDFNRLKTYPIEWTGLIFSKKALAECGFYYSANEHVCICVFCNVKVILNASQYTDHTNIEEIHKSISPYCDFANGRLTYNMAAIRCANDYRFEQHRLISFLTVNWTAPVDPYDLAKTGFYYVGTGDAARCQFCRLEVRGWEQAQTSCLGQGPSAPPTRQLGFLTWRDARHPQFARPSARLLTYDLWPIDISPRPEELIDAGFYYTGREDRVICFSCGGGLKACAGDGPSLGVLDRAWTKHAIWFPHCQYLRLTKGAKFLQQIQALIDAQPASENLLQLQQFYTFNADVHQHPLPLQAVPAAPAQAVPAPPTQTVPAPTTQAVQRISTDPKPQEEASTSRRTEATDVRYDGVRVCSVCFEKELGIVFLPCGHMATCSDCARQLKRCPICRKVANAYIRAYLP